MNDGKTGKGTFLDRVRERVEKRQKICATCGNLVRIGGTLIGCEAHDKLIIPEYPPYDGNVACPDFAPKVEHPPRKPFDAVVARIIRNGRRRYRP